jgi:transcription-repair coupling factor (superfamily II helicase)
MLSKSKPDQKYLIVLPDEDAVESYIQNLPFDFLSLHSFGASPYSGLEPSSHISPARLRFLHAAMDPKSRTKVFVTYPEALLLKTLSKKELKSKVRHFEFADAFFENPTESLLKLGYQPTQFVERPGQFCDKGGIVDIFSPAHKKPHRIELFGNDIESLRFFSVETQRTEDTSSNLNLVPATENLYSPESKANLISQLSKKDQHHSWTKDSLHKVRNGVPFSEKEFFLPLFWNDSSTALDYFDDKTHVLLFDETQTRSIWNSQFSLFKSEFENSL